MVTKIARARSWREKEDRGIAVKPKSADKYMSGGLISNNA